MKNTLIALVAIVIVGGAFYLFKYETANAPEAPEESGMPAVGTSMPVPGTETPELEATPVVTYRADGYSPASVTVKKGGTVRFANDSDTETWPASAIHPTHGVYPEKTSADCLGSAFDSCRGLKSGEVWEFTFNHVGTWRYHDHLHARHTGTIVVEE